MAPVSDISLFFSSLLPLRRWQVRAFGGVSSSFLPPPPPQSHCQVGWGVCWERDAASRARNVAKRWRRLRPWRQTRDESVCENGRGLETKKGEMGFSYWSFFPSKVNKFAVKSAKPRTFRLQSHPLGNWRAESVPILLF